MLICSLIKHRSVGISLSLCLGLSAHTAFAEAVNTQQTDSVEAEAGSAKAEEFPHTYPPRTVEFPQPHSAPSHRSQWTLQLGAFTASQGLTQDVGIEGLVGDHYTISKNSSQNVLLGLGYFIKGWESRRYRLMFGVNAFYFARTFVEGQIVQEQMFPNLGYRYSLTHYPIYLAAKGIVKTNSDIYDVTFDFGIGPNIMQASSYSESSLDDGVTIPNDGFSGHVGITWSVTAGMGVQFNRVLGTLPLEIGYRFFYLGNSHLNRNIAEYMNTLKTGNVYANALLVSLHI